MKGALELITNLQKRFVLHIVANGVSRTQDKHLRDSGLYPYFNEVFVSEDTGFQKPMKEFFEYVFTRIPAFPREKGLIIGDSLRADIRGGQRAGLDSCWFNPTETGNDTDTVPTYEIQKLDELYQILNADKRIGSC